jgi:DNA-directed RNA polymerase specialized sigma24 family protein
MLGHEQSEGMAGLETKLSWWDREVDFTGRGIRADVRLAAHEIWREASRKTETVLADFWQASELMESCVMQVSRYLDRQAVPLYSRKVNGLLMLAFTRSLQRRAAKFKRLESVGGANDISGYDADDHWSRQTEARIDLENIVRQLSERSSTVLALRYAGYEWKEIAQLLGTSVASIRNSFWREVRQVASRMRVA